MQHIITGQRNMLFPETASYFNSTWGKNKLLTETAYELFKDYR